MAEILKVYREAVPTLRFIGKRYPDFGHWGGLVRKRLVRYRRKCHGRC